MFMDKSLLRFLVIRLTTGATLIVLLTLIFSSRSGGESLRFADNNKRLPAAISLDNEMFNSKYLLKLGGKKRIADFDKTGWANKVVNEVQN